jgi:hypothetical protein
MLRIRFVATGVVLSLIAFGCSGSDSGSSSSSEEGGSNSVSTGSATGGRASSSTGGQKAKGGTSSRPATSTRPIEPTAGAGGQINAGGASVSGGSGLGGAQTSTGGSSVNGGSKAIGGTTASGGTSAIGGSKAIGGTSATGGTTQNGGASSNSCSALGSGTPVCFKDAVQATQVLDVCVPPTLGMCGGAAKCLDGTTGCSLKITLEAFVWAISPGTNNATKTVVGTTKVKSVDGDITTDTCVISVKPSSSDNLTMTGVITPNAAAPAVTFQDASVPAIGATLTSGTPTVCNSYVSIISNPTISNTYLKPEIIKAINVQTASLRCGVCSPPNCQEDVACVNP